jgi:hypothetical protein
MSNVNDINSNQRTHAITPDEDAFLTRAAIQAVDEELRLGEIALDEYDTELEAIKAQYRYQLLND